MSVVKMVTAFQGVTSLSDTYIGKAATGTSDLVPRLRKGGRCWPETERKLRSWMVEYLEKKGHSADVLDASEETQEATHG